MRETLLFPDIKSCGITDLQGVIYDPCYERLFGDENRPSLHGFEAGRVTSLAIDAVILDPRGTHQEPVSWKRKAERLASVFIERLAQCADTECDRALVTAGASMVPRQG